jgi:hypothetical protein
MKLTAPNLGPEANSMKRSNGARNERAAERWTADRAVRLLEEWKASGVSLARFARERGFNNQRLRWWKDRLAQSHDGRRLGREVPAALKFAAMVPSSRNVGAWAVTNAACVVIGAEEIRIEIHDMTSVSPTWLKEVVRALRPKGQR